MDLTTLIWASLHSKYHTEIEISTTKSNTIEIKKKFNRIKLSVVHIKTISTAIVWKMLMKRKILLLSVLEQKWKIKNEISWNCIWNEISAWMHITTIENSRTLQSNVTICQTKTYNFISYICMECYNIGWLLCKTNSYGVR